MVIEIKKRLQETFDLDSAQLINESAYGVVLAVRRISDGQIFALKTVQTREQIGTSRPHYSDEQINNNIKAIIGEISFLTELAKSIKAPLQEKHILPLLDYGLWPYNTYDYQELPALVMQKAEKTLDNLFGYGSSGQKHPFSTLDYFRWTRQIAVSLEALHGIAAADNEAYVHRDIKPSNLVLLGNDVYLIDFGIKKLLTKDWTKSRFGTRNWMAPEVALPSRMDELGEDEYGDMEYDCEYTYGTSSDLYSLGLILFWLAGKDDIPEFQERLNKYVNDYNTPTSDAKGKYGTVGGLNYKEKEQLKKYLAELFGVPGATGTGVRKGEVKNLPDLAYVADLTFTLIEKLLSIKPEDRPTAGGVIAETKRLEELLTPRIDSLCITALAEKAIEEPITVEIIAEGVGLPPDGSWLKIRLNNTSPRKIEPSGDKTWIAMFAGAQSEGEYNVTANASINGKSVSAEPATVRVTATADQLWKRGKYTEALIKDPDRQEWLDWIRTETEGDSEKCCGWAERLSLVRKAHPDHVKLNRLFFTLADECEEYGKKGNDKEEVGIWKRYAAMAAVVVLLVALGLGYMKWRDWRESTKQGAEVGTPKPVIVSKPKLASLSVTTKPAGARVYLNGKDKGTGPMKFDDLEPGEITVRAEHPGYKSTEKTVSLSPGAASEITLTLELELFRFTVKTQPSDANVKFLKSERKYTPGISLKPGKYQIAVSRSGYKTYEESVELNHKDLVVSIELEKLLARFIVNTIPADAQVRLVGLDKKYTPGMKLEPGKYRIAVSKPGYKMFEQWVKLGHEDLTLPVELENILSKLTVKTQPPDARVEFAGLNKKYTPSESSITDNTIKLQEMLKYYNCMPGLLDGKFGEKTRVASNQLLYSNKLLTDTLHLGSNYSNAVLSIICSKKSLNKCKQPLQKNYDVKSHKLTSEIGFDDPFLSNDGKEIMWFWLNTIHTLNRENQVTRRTRFSGLHTLNFGSTLHSNGIMAIAGSDGVVPVISKNKQLLFIAKSGVKNIFDVAIDRRGKLLVAAGLEGVIYVWDLKSKTILKEIDVSKGRILDVEFHSNSNLVYSSTDDDTIDLINISDGKITETLKGHKEGIPVLKMSHDGSRLFSGSWDNTVKIWDVNSNQLIKTLHASGGNIHAIDESPDGSHLAVGTYAGHLNIFDLRTGKCVQIIKNSGVFQTVSYFPDGKSFLIGTTSGTFALE